MLAVSGSLCSSVAGVREGTGKSDLCVSHETVHAREDEYALTI